MKKTLILSALALVGGTVHAAPWPSYNLTNTSGSVTRTDNFTNQEPLFQMRSKYINELVGSQTNEAIGSTALNSQDSTLKMGSVAGNTEISSDNVTATDDLSQYHATSMGGDFAPNMMSSSTIDHTNQGQQVVSDMQGGVVSNVDLGISSKINNTDKSDVTQQGHFYGDKYTATLTDSSRNSYHTSKDTDKGSAIDLRDKS